MILKLENSECKENLTETHLVNILGHIYRKVQWQKMGTRSSYDIFEHRLEYAKYEINIPAVIQKLCDRLSIQAPSYADRVDDFLSSVEYCRSNEKETFKILRSQGKLLTLLAAKRSKELRDSKPKDYSIPKFESFDDERIVS